MVRLSESNARINVRSLIAKLAIEELAEYKPVAFLMADLGVTKTHLCF